MITCWQCKKEFEGALFCPACNSLQSPPTDYFTFFGLPRHLSIDIEKLQAKFYDLSRKLHPDKYSRKSEIERANSTAATAVLNDGWRTLKNPISRAEYLLSQEGMEIGEQRSKDVPPELLEEVFELNMALEELRDGDQSAKVGLAEARAKFQTMQSASDAELEKLFTKYDGEPGPPTLAPIRAVLNRRRYISNLIRDVDKELS